MALMRWRSPGVMRSFKESSELMHELVVGDEGEEAEGAITRPLDERIVGVRPQRWAVAQQPQPK